MHYALQENNIETLEELNPAGFKKQPKDKSQVYSPGTALFLSLDLQSCLTDGSAS
jgi:hypothetical protein